MFDKYYYARVGDDHIVYSAKSNDNGVQMTLYLNDQFIDTQLGLLGTFNLSGQNIDLEVTNTALKSKHKLKYNDSSIELQKMKLKELKKILNGSDIYNEINPNKAQLKDSKFRKQKLVIPVLLMICGLIIQYYVQGMSRGYRATEIIPEAIAGWMLYTVVSERVLWVKNLRRGRLAFMAVVILGLGLLGDFLFQFF